ncbi:MAG: hypothetical protein NZ480_03500 [Bdellovibrionaceae bacterium]|nr:hypothetical protein [Pseudobdellovibrionaceae bacterium]MDW8190632.1 hypothetical protein [Pseudobdellovibrionaceae bacterium]
MTQSPSITKALGHMIVMPLFLIVLSLVFPQLSLAMPQIGDRAIFEVIFQSYDGTFEKYTQILEIIDMDEEHVLVSNTLIDLNRKTTRNITEVEHRDSLPTTQMIQDLLKDCQKNGHQLVSVSIQSEIVPACFMEDPSRSFASWYGLVPFGVVKQVSTDQEGNTVTFILKKYSFGVAP